MTALRVVLACQHFLWPTGDRSLYAVGEEAYCSTCRSRQRITEVGRAEW
jgi:hypothetical protein